MSLTGRIGVERIFKIHAFFFFFFNEVCMMEKHRMNLEEGS